MLLIAVQHAMAYEEGKVASPFPSYIASFRRWQELGRQVEKGQTGYAIIAPMRGVRRTATDERGQSRVLDRGEEPAPGETERREAFMRGFTVEKVFAAEQTTGQPIPEPPHPKLLEGEAPKGLGQAVVTLIESHRFSVDTVADAGLIGGANGRTSFTDKTVLVRSDMDDAAMVRTLIHEAAHALLHNPETDPSGAGLARGHKEVEAESVAFIVSHAHGMDAADYSFPYVAAWAGDEPEKLVAKTATRVARVAKQIIAVSPAEHVHGGRAPAPMPADRVGETQPSPAALGIGA